MIFLIDYDKRIGQLRSLRSFADAERSHAEALRLEMEIRYRSQPESEVVLLEAEDEATVRKTHARYFETLAELLRADR